MIRSLYFQTELIFHRFNGLVQSKQGFHKIHTASNPSYHWGNLLYFSAPPREGDFQKWTEFFQQEFKNHPGVQHMTFAWDGPFDGTLTTEERLEVNKFLEHGFDDEECLVLSFDIKRDQVLKTAPKFNDLEVELRPVAMDEWAQVVELALRVWPKREGHACSDDFVLGQMKSYQNMLAANLGWWMGAFVDGNLVGSLGLFFSPEVGRFQMVQVDERYRQRGLTTALLLETIKKVRAENKTQKLVIVANTDSLPAKIYQGVGFKFVEKNLGVCRAPKD